MRETQKTWIRLHLIHYGSITSSEAMRDYGCHRLASRICELRETMDIHTTMEKGKNRYGVNVAYARYHYKKGDLKNV